MSRQSAIAKKSVRLSVQPLEERALAASNLIVLTPPIFLPQQHVTAAVDHGTLRIVGTEGADNILVRQTSRHITVSGVAGSFAAAQVQKIQVFGLGGNDTIRLDSEAIGGGQPIVKPSMVQGGDGNDLVVGGWGNDSLFGNAGNDVLVGNIGRDLLVGGAGQDQARGGYGNDYIVGDLQDTYLAGEAGTDVVTFDKVDPSPLVQGNAATMKQVLQTAMAGQSFSQSHGGETITVDHMNVQDVQIVNGVTTVTLTAKIHYKKKTIFGTFSEGGDIKFTVQPQLSATFVEAHLQSASVTLANPQVLSVHLNNVPSWVTDNSTIRNFLTAKLAQVPPIPFTAQVQAYLNAGGSFGPAGGMSNTSES